jgi:hypothetical protein
MLGIGLAVAIMLGASSHSDRFAPGTWRVEGWMESDGHSTRGQQGEIKPYTVKVSPEAASYPPVTVFFSHFYGREDFSNIRFEHGRVEGSFAQRAVDDIGAHIVPVSGTYSRDRFHVVFAFTAFGTKVRQVVEGQLIQGTR